VNWEEAEPLLDRFRGIVPGQPPEPRDVIVTVYGDGGAAASAALEAAGFDADVAPAQKSVGGSGTVIRFGSKGAEAAALLGRYLPDVVFDFDDSLPGRRLELQLGAGVTVLDEPRPADAVVAPQAASTTETTVLARNTATTIAPPDGGEGLGPGVAPETTTTTVIGVVPVDSEAAASCSG
jgi:hypothetical protein